MSDLLTPCREWQGSKVAGYGRRPVPGYGDVLVHRWVMAQIHGWDAIEGKAVLHLCDNPACYRYDHLRIGTMSDNTQDMHDKRRGYNSRKDVCPLGHPFDKVLVNKSGRYAGHTRRLCSACLRDYQRKYMREYRRKAVTH